MQYDDRVVSTAEIRGRYSPLFFSKGRVRGELGGRAAQAGLDEPLDLREFFDAALVTMLDDDFPSPDRSQKRDDAQQSNERDERCPAAGAGDGGSAVID
jgi:hypothetical protein